MAVLFEQYWWLLVIALLIGVIVAWIVFSKSRKTRVETKISPDVLDDGAAPAQRNQALIDAPPAAAATMKAPSSTPAHAPVSHPAQAEAEAVPAPDAAPAVPEDSASPQPAAMPVQDSDDLTRIKGLGPKIAQLLQTLGITRFEQIAAWNEADIDRIDAQLGKFQGRIRRDSWVEQATYLAKGDTDGFEGRFGKI